MMVLLGVVVFLFAFASSRNAVRNLSQPNIKFIGENNLFITNETVSKLLIQNYNGVKKMPKETLVLNELENTLKSNPMIKAAEVYVSVNGALNAVVEQKTPIARISTNASYYIDDEGSFMPLSKNYSARVPLVTGFVEKNNLKNLYEVATKVKKDEFLQKHVYEIHQDNNKQLYFKLRTCDFIVKLGDNIFLDKKINNLKAFYRKNQKDKNLKSYSKVNLQFENQVICTKI